MVLLLINFTQAIGGQKHWRQIAQPTSNNLLKVYFLNNDTGWVVGREGTILKTTDAGMSWQQQHSNVTTDINDIFMVNERVGWALTWENFVDTATFYGTRILKTTNGGEIWKTEDFSTPEKFLHAITFLDSLKGWVGGSEGILYQTIDGGVTWIPGLVEPSNYANFPIRKFKFFSPNYGLGVGGIFDIAGVVWKTTNGGENWVAGLASAEPLWGIQFVDSLHIICISGDFEFGASMIRTRNAGESWEYSSLETFGQPRAMAFRTANEGWICLANFFMVTYDTASTWAMAETTSTRQVFDFVFTDSATGYAVADSGIIFKYSNEVTGIVESPHIPVVAKLLQNYPNPFNPKTVIRFSIGPSPSGTIPVVKLKIYDLIGREVALLLNAPRSAGDYSIGWEPANIPSGIYFYKLSYDSFVDVKKMIFLK